MINFQNKGGISILGVILLGIILILVLSYFGFDIKSLVENPKTQDNLNYVGGVLEDIWDNVLKKPVMWVWDNVLEKLFNNIKDSDALKLEDMAPELPQN